MPTYQWRTFWNWIIFVGVVCLWKNTVVNGTHCISEAILNRLNLRLSQKCWPLNLNLSLNHSFIRSTDIYWKIHYKNLWNKSNDFVYCNKNSYICSRIFVCGWESEYELKFLKLLKLSGYPVTDSTIFCVSAAFKF